MVICFTGPKKKGYEMKVGVVQGTVLDLVFGENTVALSLLDEDENGGTSLDLRWYPKDVTPLVKIYKHYNTRGQFVKVDTTDLVDIFYINKPNDKYDTRKFLARALRAVNAEGYTEVMSDVEFDPLGDEEEIKNKIGRIVLGIRDFVEKNPDHGIKKLVLCVRNEDMNIVEGLRVKLSGEQAELQAEA